MHSWTVAAYRNEIGYGPTSPYGTGPVRSKPHRLLYLKYLRLKLTRMGGRIAAKRNGGCQTQCQAAPTCPP